MRLTKLFDFVKVYQQLLLVSIVLITGYYFRQSFILYSLTVVAQVTRTAGFLRIVQKVLKRLIIQLFSIIIIRFILIEVIIGDIICIVIIVIVVVVITTVYQ